MSGRRLPFVDWLRGIGVVIMIEAHVLDAWMRLADRSLPHYTYARILAGWAAPTFLFLAGLSLTMGMGRQSAKGVPDAEAGRIGLRRGWRIFGIAFLFRLQSVLVSGGTLRTFLKVDILNVMGLAMVLTAALWRLSSRPWGRALALAAGAAAISLATPLVRLAAWPAPWPDALEAYIRPVAGRATFTLFPWAGFVVAGGAAGLAMARLSGEAGERRLMRWFGWVGLAAAAGGYGLSFLPSPYVDSQFWTSSPTFFLLRCGVMLTALAAVWLATPLLAGPWAGAGRVLTRLGTSSLFIYWIHIEIVYGLISRPIQKRFSFSETALAWVVLVAAMYGAVLLKDRILARWSGGDWFGTPARTPARPATELPS